MFSRVIFELLKNLLSNYIVRDTDKPYIYVVSKKIVDIINKFKFKMNFLEY